MGSIRPTMSGCMGSDKRVQILLSTYNGERYLREQLESYIALEGFEKYCVLVRDDGSTDGTREILREYKEKYGFEVLFGENVGVNESYHILLTQSSDQCDYFALSDQDDVWLPHKLKCAVKRLDNMPGEKPRMFFSLSQITDANLNPVAVSNRPIRGVSFLNAMVENVCPGHTQVFDQKLKQLLLTSWDGYIHVVDWWVYLVASGLGEIVYEPTCTVLHRQHGNNTVGYEVNRFRHFKTRLRRARAREGRCITRQLEHFRASFYDLLPKEYAQELCSFIECQSTLWNRIKYSVTSKIYRQTSVETCLVKTLYMLGNYRL